MPLPARARPGAARRETTRPGRAPRAATAGDRPLATTRSSAPRPYRRAADPAASVAMSGIFPATAAWRPWRRYRLLVAGDGHRAYEHRTTVARAAAIHVVADRDDVAIHA